MLGKIEIPTCLSGSIISAGSSICMDGASQLIDTPSGAFRLVAKSEELQKELLNLVDTKKIVTVCGYIRRGAECDHLVIYSVDSITEDPSFEAKSLLKTTNTSKGSGSTIEEALNNAIAQAKNDMAIADALVEWELSNVKGQSGGIAGLHEVTVEINY